MELSQVAPELRRPSRSASLFPTDRAWGRRVVRALLAVMPDGKLDGVTIEKPSSAEQHVRVYHPAVRRSATALFWIHGGGLIIGHAVQDDRLCTLTTRALGVVVVSAECRKAPEQSFPAALDDCYAGWRWLRREDFKGQPPAWIGVRDIDLFYDEDHEYAERLRAAAVPVTFAVVPGAPHGFEAWAPTTAIVRDHISRAQT